MPHANVHPVGMVYQPQKFQYVVPVIQGLPDAHEHDVGYLPPGVHLGKQHLIQHLRWSQIPHPPGNGGCAEGAAHAAPHLGGDAHGVAVVVLHEYGLDAVSILQLP